MLKNQFRPATKGRLSTLNSFLIIIWLAGLPFDVLTQNLTQTIRGTVIDADTREPLVGAEVFVIGTDPFIGTSTDATGGFELLNVPVGRIGLQCQYVGYLPVVRDQIQLNSAREYSLEILMKTGLDLTEVTVKAYTRNQAVNDATVASIRRIDPEELQYHAATANDPGRLVQGFPGVQPSRDNGNDIIIRGNASSGILWRLEGIDILNPNHFAQRGSTGGGITIFSASMLGSSDFLTGAFPAEYGNVSSGVFDMKFRNGNLQQTQQTIRAGLLGLDYAAEGPITKGKSSYLANFRYSTLGILNSLGLHLVGPRTDNNFQDFSFKIYHKGLKSQLSFWGIGGNSRELFNEEKMPWKTYSDYTRYKFTTQMGVIGVSWNHLIDKQSFFQINSAMMGQDVLFRDDTLSPELQIFSIGQQHFKTNQYVFNAFYKRSFSPQLNFKIGSNLTSTGYDLVEQKWNRQNGIFQTLIKAQSRVDNLPGVDSRLLLQQYYGQINYRPSPKWTLNLGTHLLISRVGKVSSSLEPRLSMLYTFSPKTNIALSYTRQSRVLPIGSYFTLVAGSQYPNLNLGLLKSTHYIAAINQLLGDHFNFHAEIYLQHLSRVPVSTSGNRIYWMLNDIQGFASEALTQEGTGRNLGLDIYLEKFYHQGTFFVFSTSIYNSTFEVPGYDNRFNTQYNARFAMTFTGGKNFQLNNSTTLETGFRLIFNAGQPITPLAPGYETTDGEDPVLDELRPFTERVTAYVRPDLRIALRRNKANSAYWLALDIQNIINRENEDFIDYKYSSDPGRWQHRLQSGLTPLLTFQLDF